MDKLEIIYQDDELVAINKPHGLLVHRSRIATDATEFALQILRNQINQRVYPTHRLDRKTSGVLLFAKTKDANKVIQSYFREGRMFKAYHAIVRGFIETEGTINYTLQNEGKSQAAVTHFKSIDHFELPIPLGKHNTSRYSLVELLPETGRFHQLRKHMKHIFHPILGDRPHGCNKQNKLWKEKFDMHTMMLHACSLSFQHNDQTIAIKADYSQEFNEVLEILRNKIA